MDFEFFFLLQIANAKIFFFTGHKKLCNYGRILFMQFNTFLFLFSSPYPSSLERDYSKLFLEVVVGVVVAAAAVEVVVGVVTAAPAASKNLR